MSRLKNFIERQDFISEDEVKICVEKSFAELKKREWACDIHMLDFVTDNYLRQQIFYSPNHPTQNVIMELAHRILDFMDISDKSFFMTDALLDIRNSLIGQDIPIYPKVKKILGLQNSLEEYFANRYLPNWTFRANYLDFLIEYVKLCWKDKIIL